MLIEKGADIHIQDSYEKTALTWAVEKGQTEIAKMLFEETNKVTVRDFGVSEAMSFKASRLLNYVGYKNSFEIEKKSGTCQLKYDTKLPPTLIVAVGIIPVTIAALAVRMKHAVTKTKHADKMVNEHQNSPIKPITVC